MKNILFILILSSFAAVFAQDSINVTFRYTAGSSVVRVMLPGEFNNWGPNSSGIIAIDAPSLMEKEDGVWYKTIGLKIGGGSTIINSEHVYQYKIHEHLNSTGTSNTWLTDPLNPNFNPQDNNNSYLDVTHPLIFQIEPTASKIVRNSQPAITATVAAKKSDSIDVGQSMLYINDVQAGTFTGYYNTEKQLLKIPSLSVYDAALETGLNEIKIIAVTKSGESHNDSLNVNYVVNPDIVDEPLPDGMIDGINYLADPSEVTLSLFAPYKKFVYLIGDFNNWMVSAEYFMKRDSVSADSIHWWITLSGLTPGTEYGYQYLIDDEIRVADPYTDKVLDPWNDSYISESTYPGLKEYPSDKTTEIASVFQTNQTPYEWQVTDFERPQAEKLVIYELLLRDFIAKHDYTTLIDTLTYLKNLGVNAIELMPVNEFEGNSSWGYNPSFYFALDKYYGPKDDFKAFVDACHQNGIAVIMDMVLNHSYGQSPFVRLYNEGLYGKPTSQNPWYNVTSPNSTYSWGYDLNHESQATKKLVDRVNHYWLSEYKVDGFRFDFTKGFTNTPGDGGNYDASRISILKRMADKIWEADSSTYIILEHFAPNMEEEELSDYGMMLWGNTNYNYNEATMGWISNSDFGWGFYKNRGWAEPNLVTYMESHDEERLMYKNLHHGNSSGDYDITELTTALNRQKLAGAFFFTLPGPKMIWQFGELGYDYSIDYNGRVGEKPIKWDYLDNADRNRLYRTWAALIKLRNENPVFCSTSSSIDMNVQNEVKCIRLSNSDLNAIVIGNFDVISRDVTPNFYHGGRWYDFFSGDSIDITDTNISYTYGPGEFHIYTDKRTFKPQDDLLSDIIENPTEALVKDFVLSQNYPNPFNPTTIINYELRITSNVQLTVYNTLGQEVRNLVSRRQKAGKHTITFKATGLSSGIYFYKLQAGDFSAVKRMLLLK